MVHVLIADDDAFIRSTTAMVLEDAGYTVTEVADANTMLRLLKTASSPHVVLLDLGLPHMDTGALLRLLIHARMRMPQHAYVLFTAHAPQTYALWLPLIEQLAMLRLNKPFDIDDLLAVMTQAAASLPLAVPALVAALPH